MKDDPSTTDTESNSDGEEASSADSECGYVLKSRKNPPYDARENARKKRKIEIMEIMECLPSDLNAHEKMAHAIIAKEKKGICSTKQETKFIEILTDIFIFSEE